MPTMQRSVEVLPAPLGPMRPTISPGAALNERRSTAVRVPKVFVRLETAIMTLPGPRHVLDQMPIVSGPNQLMVGIPDVVGYLLRNLKSLVRIHADPLKVTDHNADDVVRGERLVGVSGQVFIEGKARRRNEHVRPRPHL